MSKLTSNQLYGGMNRRFTKRASLLRKFGFKYQIVFQGIAAFVKPIGHKTATVSAAEVLHSNNKCWIDTLRSILKGPVY